MLLTGYFTIELTREYCLPALIGNVIFIAYLIWLTIGISDFSSQEGVSMFAVLIAYPLMNALLTIPALPILLGLWKERPWSIPWTFKSLSFILHSDNRQLVRIHNTLRLV